MILLFVFVDVISMLLSVVLATAAGERAGNEFFPNILVLVVSFLLLRTLLVWVLFKSIVNRELHLSRNFFQIIFLLTSLSVLSFVLTAIPTYLISSETKFGQVILFFTNIQGQFFYLLVVPGITFIISLVVHKLYKLEPW